MVDKEKRKRENMVDKEKRKRENFLRCAVLFEYHSKSAFILLIEKDLQLKGVTFEQFLNCNQHAIFHMCFPLIWCCQCVRGRNKSHFKVLDSLRFELLYQKSKKLHSNHINRACTNDFCCSAAKPSVTLDMLDMSLVIFFLVNFCFDVFWNFNLHYKKQSLEDFLNAQKHTIYHLWKNSTRCCHCPPVFKSILRFPKLDPTEWQTMFHGVSPQPQCSAQADVAPCNSLCMYQAFPAITISSLNPLLQQNILDHCCPLRQKVKALVKMRKEKLRSLLLEAKLSDSEFETIRTELEQAIIYIELFCKNECAVRKAINSTLTESFDNIPLKKHKEIFGGFCQIVENDFAKRRYFVFASVVCEVVMPTLKQRLSSHLTSHGFPDLQAFINDQATRHKLFHLMFKGCQCCYDTSNCTSLSSSPLIFFNWNYLYDENAKSSCKKRHVCHFKFQASRVALNDLDITLICLIVTHTCCLAPMEVAAVQRLQEFRNKFLRYNLNTYIRRDMFDDLWKDLVTDVLTLDPNRQDDLRRIKHRPLDDKLCAKYDHVNWDFHKKHNKVMITDEYDVEPEIQNVKRYEDLRRYFVFISALCNVVIPIFRQRLRNYITSKGFQDFRTFINHQPTRHKLFHLLFKDSQCCTDTTNCYNRSNSQLTFYQWNVLYDNNINSNCIKQNICHCKFVASGQDLRDIDVYLIGLILTEICSLPSNEVAAVHRLNKFNDNFLGTVDGCISWFIFGDLWKSLVTNVFTLDQNMQDKLKSIQHQPLDEELCQEYQRILHCVHIFWVTEYMPDLCLLEDEEQVIDLPDLCLLEKERQKYNIQSDPSGIALIINNIHFNNNLQHRHGAEKDSLRMKILFNWLNFEVDVKENLTTQEMFTTLKELSQSEQLYSVDSLVVVLMSHGNNEMIVGADGQNLPVIELVKLFNANSCPAMKAKPKMFIVNACRGDDKDYEIAPSSTSITFGATIPTYDEAEVDARPTFLRGQPANSDIVIAYSTFPGYVSYRDPTEGSWFIKCFEEVFSELASVEHVLDMLTQEKTVFGWKIGKQTPD